ncbi:hypothetical protein WJX74_009549 [Apatococcus lobatus]|uniref:Uncharacterized protein n=1 Tax=Apatococcus lobatus TaxID=904363 RepID=A0AAW1RLT7_9CHLO
MLEEQAFSASAEDGSSSSEQAEPEALDFPGDISAGYQLLPDPEDQFHEQGLTGNGPPESQSHADQQTFDNGMDYLPMDHHISMLQSYADGQDNSVVSVTSRQHGSSEFQSHPTSHSRRTAAHAYPNPALPLDRSNQDAQMDGHAGRQSAISSAPHTQAEIQSSSAGPAASRDCELHPTGLVDTFPSSVTAAAAQTETEGHAFGRCEDTAETNGSSSSSSRVLSDESPGSMDPSRPRGRAKSLEDGSAQVTEPAAWQANFPSAAAADGSTLELDEDRKTAVLGAMKHIHLDYVWALEAVLKARSGLLHGQ